MSRFRKLSHSIWHCQYHIVWVPKYRYRVLAGPIHDAVYKGIHAICGYSGAEVVEMNVQKDHIHLKTNEKNARKTAPAKACSSDELSFGPFSEQAFASALLGGKIGIKILTQNYENFRAQRAIIGSLH